MRFRYSIFIFSISNLTCLEAQPQNYLQSGIDFFNAVKNNEFEKAEIEIKTLANVSEDVLKGQLDTEVKAKAFWLNIYNTFVQYLLKKNPALFKDRSEFFKTRHITIANQKLSLDDIEHGIIRHSRNKYSMGYLGKISVSDFEKKFRLEDIDYRIHFALNCGAKSCPAVALYKGDQLNVQLDKSTKMYLKSFARYHPGKNIVWAPMLCSWFKGDFGGEDGVIEMMKKYKIVPLDKDPGLEYLAYDWTLKLSNYVTL